MNHDSLEKNAGLLGILIALVVSIGGLAEIVPLMMSREAVEPAEGTMPYTAMQLEGRHTLFVLPREADMLYKSLRNLKGVRVLRSHELNAYTVLWADNLVFTEQALSGAEEVFGS